METIINNQHYKIPNSIVEINNNAVDFYGVMNLSEVFTGGDDFERIENATVLDFTAGSFSTGVS